MTPEVQYGIVATLSAMIFVVAIVLIFVVLRDLKNRVSSTAKVSNSPLIRIDPQDNPGLLLAAMRTFEGSGQISFEGIDDDTGLPDLVGATVMGTDALRRASLFGSSDNFVVIPLTKENIIAIRELITWEADDAPESERSLQPSNFCHVQIATENRFVFGAYDNFSSDCVVATDKFPLDVLERLVANGVIRSYEVVIDGRPMRVGWSQVPT